MRELDQLREKDINELCSLLAEKRKKLVKTRLDLKLKKIKNVHQSKFIRKKIARILTIIREKKLMEEEKKNQ